MNNRLVDSDIRHGGDIQNVVKLYGGNSDEWLDLSTGISPWSYPAPTVDESVWRELPSSNETLIAAAAVYYGCDESQIISTPGSQLAIRLIPQLIEPKQTVAIPLIGYQEHAKSWQMAGHCVKRYTDYDQLLELVNTTTIDNAVVINPNNPTGESVAPERLKLLSENLAGILLVDEAFSDTDPSSSVCKGTFKSNSNVIALKSIGKFFGLAGARIGFAIGAHPVVKRLNQLLSPWSISGPSISLASLALSDTRWQTTQRQRIGESAQAQRHVLNSIEPAVANYTCNDQGLFFSIFAQNKTIVALHAQLVEQKVWTRLGDPFSGQGRHQLNWLRLSLAGDHLNRLSTALKSININQSSSKQSSVSEL